MGEKPDRNKTLASHDFLSKIEDPAIRCVVESIIAERNDLKSENNILKSRTRIYIDRRPSSSHQAGQSVLEILPAFTPSEKDALLDAINPTTLKRKGLKIGPRGEILDQKGKQIHLVSFEGAIKKALGENINNLKIAAGSP